MTETPREPHGCPYHGPGICVIACFPSCPCRSASVTPRDAETEAYPSLESWVQGAAGRHHYDATRQCCSCGFCAWTPEHIAVMAYREAVAARRNASPSVVTFTGEWQPARRRRFGC